jgi:hypothetical protein
MINRYRGWLSGTITKPNIPFIKGTIGSNQVGSVEKCNASLAMVSARSRSPRLLLAGCALEHVIKVVTLVSLAEGFNVYPLADLISVSENTYEAIHWQRPRLRTH